MNDSGDISRGSRFAVLIAAIIASGMGMIDSTAVNVALPRIQCQLNATAVQVQWIAEGYLLFLCALILIGGAVGDRYGRRRFFTLGTWIFGASSIGCAMVRDPSLLIVARCLQGVGAALMIPESLALISAVYGAPERGRAIGIWSAASAVTMAAGPVLGGWLTEISWRWVFLINIPLVVAVLLLAHLCVPESYGKRGAGRLDALGSGLVTVALGLVVVALVDMQQGLANPRAWAFAVAGALAFAAFLSVERRSSSPVLPLRLFRSRTFSLASIYTFFLYAALGGVVFYLPFELIDVMRYTPLDAGIALLPTIAIVAALSPFAGAVATRAGTRLPLVLGALVATAGFAWFERLGPGASYATSVLPATIAAGTGLGIAIAPLLAAVMSAAGTGDVGAASGINSAISRLGNLVAIAVFGVVIAAAAGGALPAVAAKGCAAAHEVSAGFQRGFGDAMFGAAAMSLVAAIIALALPRVDTLPPISG